MALIHPRSLDRWQEWQHSRHRLRHAKHALTGTLGSLRGSPAAEEPAPTLVRHRREGEDPAAPRVLIGVDSATPSSRASLLTALPYLTVGVDVLAPAGVELPELGGPEWSAEPLTDARRALDEEPPAALLTLGHHLGVGRVLHDWALETGVRTAVVQHGALTPFAPPLPADTTLLAWSDADAAFHRSGREDVATRTVGSQLLWQAAHESESAPSPAGGQIVFLGQMHGAELPRRLSAGIPYEFCRREGAVYRPHPAETDRVSRAAHALMRRRGIEVVEPTTPLPELDGPVVGIFSTGILEAAVRGRPAWVTGRSMPDWVREFWERYGMRRWGGPPTQAPAVGADEPARLIAQFLEDGA